MKLFLRLLVLAEWLPFFFFFVVVVIVAPKQTIKPNKNEKPNGNRACCRCGY